MIKDITKLWLATFLHLNISKTRPNQTIDGVLDLMTYDCRKNLPPLELTVVTKTVETLLMSVINLWHPFPLHVLLGFVQKTL